MEMNIFPRVRRLIKKQIKVTLRFPYDSMVMSNWVLTRTLIRNILKPLRYPSYASRYLQASYLANKHARLRVLFIFLF